MKIIPTADEGHSFPGRMFYTTDRMEKDKPTPKGLPKRLPLRGLLLLGDGLNNCDATEECSSVS